MAKLKPPLTAEAEAVEILEGEVLGRAIWSGSVTIGLVNIPVKAVPITRDKRIHFRMLHKKCQTPIHYSRVCEEGEAVPEEEIVYGYRLAKGKYILFEKSELKEARPESSDQIELDRFVNFFQVDPHYFDRTYFLKPDGSEKAYSLLRTVMDKTGKAAMGRMTISAKEHIVLVHYYQDAIVATTLRYPDEVITPSLFPELKGLPEPTEKELSLAREIVDKLTGELDLSQYRDGYREMIEALVESKMGKEVVLHEAKKGKPAPRSLMEALRETAESFKG
jgi:DNA end-binding protein Ku